MKTFPVYTILWVVSFLVKHGQPASLPSTATPDINISDDFVIQPKSGQTETLSYIKGNTVAARLVNVQGNLTSETRTTPFMTSENTNPNREILTNTSYKTTPTSVNENVTQSSEQTYMDTSEETRNTSENATTQYSATTISIYTTTKVALGGKCETNISCEEEFAICKDQLCVCQENYFKYGYECKKKIPYGQPCTNEECIDKNAECIERKCTCSYDYFWKNGKCLKKAALRDKCETSEANNSCRDKFAICQNETCVCQNDYFRDLNECKKKIPYGHPCTNEDCVDRRAHCNDGKCVCYEVYYRKNGKCIKKLKFGVKCEKGDQCSDRNAFCSSETSNCACNDNYKLKNNKCVKIVFPYWWLAIIIVILLLVIFIFCYLFFRKFKQTSGKVTFLKLRPFKTLAHKRPYKIKNFIHIESKTFIQDYKIIGKVNPFILTEESDLNSNDTFLPCYEAQKPSNKKKNRFLNVLPFDQSRVKLEVVDDDPYTDYINASYITGYNQEKEYIACQGPLIHTVDDFWRMVWQENINLIVMLTLCEENGKHKCYPYWPKKEKLKVISRDLLLETDVVITHEYYHESSILVNMDEETRVVKHLHFQKWPDFSATVDPTVLINFIKIIRSHFTQSPILIHCSAGVGRTGTLIAVDYMMQYVRDHTLDDSIDLFAFVYKMRESRPQMVQNQDQYLLINTCIKRAIMDKFNLKATQVNKEEDNKKNEIKVDVEEGGETEKDTETDEDGADDDDNTKTLTDKVDGKEDDTEEPTVIVEANVVAESTNKVENAKDDVTEEVKDDGENVDEVTDDTGEDKDANSNICSNAYDEEDDERVPLTQAEETSEL